MIARASTTQTMAHAVTKIQPIDVDLIPPERPRARRSFPACSKGQDPSEMSRCGQVTAVGSADIEAPAARPSPHCGLMRMACRGTPERARPGGAVAIRARGRLLLSVVRDAAAGRTLRPL